MRQRQPRDLGQGRPQTGGRQDHRLSATKGKNKADVVRSPMAKICKKRVQSQGPSPRSRQAV
jgi:hypothetical protein